MVVIRLGTSGLKVSRLALGCMSFGDTSRGFNQWALDGEAAAQRNRRRREMGATARRPADRPCRAEHRRSYDWRAMQDLHKQGRIHAIGVSNFYPDRLVDLIEHNEIAPMVNQVETHPFFQRVDYQQLMAERGVQIESWGPFAEGRNNLFTDPVGSATSGSNNTPLRQEARNL
jgi:aryl-alcohol dehydrogenase-like predicted oxidoreductase